MYNKKIAIAVMLLMIAISIPFGGYRSLNKLYNQVNRAFYQGVDGDGLGIENDLNNRIDNSYNLVTIAKKYIDADNAVIENTLDARDSLVNSKSISDKYKANLRLTEAVEELYTALGAEELKLTDQDKSYRRSLYSNLTSRNDTISHDGYNDKAAEFNNILEGFPASLISRVVGINKAELFR
ncbi:LemA family protein [Alloiococcus sp. CFN-8]|uniref:LemA family protein n=1 Tax=Alloiococcus sp. CFN-8 TaxID=3416081 RepID=UPI003CED338E